VTRIDAVVWLVTELRSHERQTAEESGQWKTHHEERKVIDASPGGNRTGRAPWSSLPEYSPPMARPPTGVRGWMA